MQANTTEHLFSKHDNRHAFQNHGVYFGQVCLVLECVWLWLVLLLRFVYAVFHCMFNLHVGPWEETGCRRAESASVA